MDSSFSRLSDIDEKSTVYVLRIAFSFLSAAALFSLIAVLTYVQAGTPEQTYVAGLSAIINAIAAYHYNEMIKVRTKARVSIEIEWKIDALRHSDWAVTMPLLVLKLYALINNPEQDLLLRSVDASALCAVIMVLLGAYARLGLEELADFKGMQFTQQILGVACYLGSVALLVFLLIDLSNAYSGVSNTEIFFAFFLVWPCYGITAIGAVFLRQGQASSYPRNLALTKDVVYAGLDIFSKAVFAWYTSSAAFHKSVLGS